MIGGGDGGWRKPPRKTNFTVLHEEMIKEKKRNGASDQPLTKIVVSLRQRRNVQLSLAQDLS